MTAYRTDRVRLDVDLTRYHLHLTPGTEGVTVKGAKVSDWGSFDRFWAVEWDCCGHVMDTVRDSLTVTESQEQASAAVVAP